MTRFQWQIENLHGEWVNVESKTEAENCLKAGTSKAIRSIPIYPNTTNTPTPELEPTADEELEQLLGEYWDFAYTEGDEGRRHDTYHGDAQLVRSDIFALFKSQAATIASLTAERDAMLRELKAATGHDDGLLAIRHLILRAETAEGNPLTGEY